jgi:hypothetical protein
LETIAKKIGFVELYKWYNKCAEIRPDIRKVYFHREWAARTGGLFRSLFQYAPIFGIFLFCGCESCCSLHVDRMKDGSDQDKRDRRRPRAAESESPAARFAIGPARPADGAGLVRFEASGQIEPALAQRWIVSNDGLRYTFRLANAQWSNGGRVTAAQVVARLRAAMGPASRNRVKPILGAIDEVEAMTDDVLEITLKAPRPRFLDLLAQPEMAIIRNGQGSGPYRALARADGSIRLTPPIPTILAWNRPAGRSG